MSGDKGEYVLGGRAYDPQKTETEWDKYNEGCFNVGLGSLTDDTVAIQKSDEFVQREFQRLTPGKKLVVALWRNNRIVKNYPAQVKE
ncbi:MAG: hypothetical protein QG579_445 [Patescibacteria group bacterium]|jgi:hypothetical protein|nr:hypothetical protein [Patescibacteria group bacterium]